MGQFRQRYDDLGFLLAKRNLRSTLLEIETCSVRVNRYAEDVCLLRAGYGLCIVLLAAIFNVFYVYYIFYPLHLLILALITRLFLA